MVSLTKVNGLVKIDMASDYRNGQMEQDTKVIGKIIKLKEGGNFSIYLEIPMKVNGKMIKQMAMEFTYIIKAQQNMKDSGLMIFNREKDYKYMQMEISIKVNFLKVEDMERVNIPSQMVEYTMDNGIKAKWKEKEYLSG